MHPVYALLTYFVCTFSQPTLPIPARDIPLNLSPPLNHGRIDTHGWLWLPVGQNESHDDHLKGWFYHHTPEFFHDSPHNFELMVQGVLVIDKILPGWRGFGEEFVFTPSYEFSLDDTITSTQTKYWGNLYNGSFDTKYNRTFLATGTLYIQDLVTVHYLDANQAVGYSNLVYISYPQTLPEKSNKVSKYNRFQKKEKLINNNKFDAESVHLYLLHLEEKSPDFDQVIHVIVNTSTCQWKNGQSIKDINVPGATFVFPETQNIVTTRLYPSDDNDWITSILVTANSNMEAEQKYITRDDNTKVSYSGSECQMKVIEEIHCVVVPDSFADCPSMEI